jgi:hypothetical protein
MRWWNGRSLRTKIFVAFSTLILAVLLATLGLTQLVVGREAGRALARDLRTTGQVFESLLAERTTRLQTNSTLLASDFALKRVFATHFDPASYDPETLASAGLSYRQRIGVQLVWMTDEAGKLLAASPANDRVGQSLAGFLPLKETLETQAAAAGVVEVDGKIFQMVAVPVFGPDVIGFLMLGQVIDDPVAARLKVDTHSDVTFLTTSKVFASSWPASAHGNPQAAPHSSQACCGNRIGTIPPSSAVAASACSHSSCRFARTCLSPCTLSSKALTTRHWHPCTPCNGESRSLAPRPWARR